MMHTNVVVHAPHGLRWAGTTKRLMTLYSRILSWRRSVPAFRQFTEAPLNWIAV